MASTDRTLESQPDRARRLVLAGVAGAYAGSLIPWALAQPVRGAEHGAFVAVSAILVGRPSLDAALAERLYDALVADDASFPAGATFGDVLKPPTYA